jgi:hypothetical protein
MEAMKGSTIKTDIRQVKVKKPVAPKKPVAVAGDGLLAHVEDTISANVKSDVTPIKVVLHTSDPRKCIVEQCTTDPSKTSRMMVYNGRPLCVGHFNELCKRRDKTGNPDLSLEIEFKVIPEGVKPQLPKSRQKKEKGGGGFWQATKELAIGVIKSQKEPMSVEQILGAMIKQSWEVPQGGTHKKKLYKVLRKAAKAGDLVKSGKGLGSAQFGIVG